MTSMFWYLIAVMINMVAMGFYFRHEYNTGKDITVYTLLAGILVVFTPILNISLAAVGIALLIMAGIVWLSEWFSANVGNKIVVKAKVKDE